MCLWHIRQFATNVFAQSGKCRVECIYFPCDTAPELVTRSPKGFVDVYPRKVDLQNVEKLKKFEKTTVVLSIKELEEHIEKRKIWLKKYYF